MSNLVELHWEALKYLIKYLKGTKKLGFMFKTDKIGFSLKGCVDFHFVGNSDSRKSRFYCLLKLNTLLLMKL